MLPELAIIGGHRLVAIHTQDCAQSVALARVVSTVWDVFENVVQKISLNRLIHRKTWNTTENSLEKVRISAKTRWENVQGHKTGRNCNSYTMLRVFFTAITKKWVHLNCVGIPIYDN